MKLKGPAHLLLCGTLLCAAALAHAQDAEEDAEAEDTVGGPRLDLSLEGSGYYTDNNYSQRVDPEPSRGTLIRPRLAYLNQTRRVEVDAVAEGEYGMFDTGGGEDDYLDAVARADGTWYAGLRHRFGLAAGVQRDHDSFGASRTEDAAARDRALDQWYRRSAGLRYRFGTPAARLNLEFGASTVAKEYFTNEDATRFLDHDDTTLDYSVIYNYSPKTSSVFSYSRTLVEFDEPFASGDSREGTLERWLGGARWLATAKTSGDVRVGYRRRDFDGRAKPLTGFDWEAGIHWSPAALSLIDLRTGRSEQQSYRADARLIDTQYFSVGLRRTWTARFSSRFAATRSRADFLGAGRTDVVYDLSLSGDFMVSSRVFVVGGASIADRDSTDLQREFSRTSATLGIRANL